MVLPLNLAMTASEIVTARSLPANIAWMACHFSSEGTGLDNLPAQLPEGFLLILDDSIPCCGHSADQTAEILYKLVSRFHCCGVLLDFQRSCSAESATIAAALVDALPCPVVVPPEYAKGLPCPVFLPPAPLHMPLERYLKPWKNREIWLEAALCCEVASINKNGATYLPSSAYPGQSGDFYSERLYCRYMTKILSDCISFTLFDTPETLERKLVHAHSLGVTRAVGLYQELGDHFSSFV